MSNYLLDPSAHRERRRAMSPPRKPQVRLRYSKLGKVRFTSHRDMARVWERAIRKVQLPIAYSEGFSPRAKLSFGLALPTVFESAAEYVDITLEETVDVDPLPEMLTQVMPAGIDVTGAMALHGKVESLQECVESTTWSLFMNSDPDELQTWAADLMAADELLVTRERKGKSRTDDVRPAILEIEVKPGQPDDVPAATAEVFAHLAAKPRALRPLELLEINPSASTEEPSRTSVPSNFVLGRRIHQFIAPVGARRDPLAVGAAEAPHSLSCAS